MSVDVEGIQQLIVVVSEQVQTSGPRLDDTDDLRTRGHSSTDIDLLTPPDSTGQQLCDLTSSHLKWWRNSYCEGEED